MLSITSAQLDAWIAAFIFPLTRILAVIATAPFWGSAAIPRRIRLVLGLAIAVGLAPALPPMPAVSPVSGPGVWILAQQLIIGVGMGLAMRIVYSAVDIAGELMGLQMGLGFATFYDPTSASQTPVVTEFMDLLALLVFLALNGHLLYVATLAQSFNAIPVGMSPLGSGSWLNLVELGSRMFAAGLLLALPVVVALLITNIALAVLSRAAPQLNIMSIGFPITLIGGFVVLAMTLNYLATPLQAIFEQGLTAMLGFATR
ncbi:MAG TPA: flagellar biosynthetic protein FliR [Rhodocyclaceae bacterium]|nr:flagellar biosynthetic protein FliR [Rhodocyclaceae bacterium]